MVETGAQLRRGPAARQVLAGAVILVATACTSADGGSGAESATVASTTEPATTTAPTPATTLPPETITTTVVRDRDEQLQDLIAEWAADHDPVGVAAAVLFPGGDLWLGAAGLADREGSVPVVPFDRFEVASITKPFMATVTLRLAEEGVIALDDPIAGYLPDFPEGEAITVRHLLGHRAGIYDPTPQLVSDRDGPPDPLRVFTSEELVAAAAEGSPTFPPGSRHEYSNAGYWVLAAVLEEATGRDAAALLNQYVIEPLGLADTVLFDASLPDVAVVNAYSDLDLDGVEDAMGDRPLPGYVTPAWTAGGMISTVTDLVTFVDGLFSGQVLTPESLDAMLDTASGGGSYALGIYRANGLWGHDGGIKGYLSAVFHDEGTGVTVAVVTNRFGPDAPQADALAPRLAGLANQFAEQ
jgi:D-alanyl-D-alanine carboxypeptidase